MSIDDAQPVRKQRLTPAELAQVEELVRFCGEYEGLRMRVETTRLSEQRAPDAVSFLYFVSERLVGFADSYGRREKELTGMVHPEYRRRGIFRALLAAAQKEAVQQSAEGLLLICEDVSASGKACMQALGAQLEHAEHEMVLGSLAIKGFFDDRLLLRRAESADFEAIAMILAGEFGDDEEQARQHVARMTQYEQEQYYIATLGGEELGCHEPVGVLRLSYMPRQIGIYGFVVRPEYRGRGYGRQILEETLLMLRREHPQTEIMLEVETTNANAIGLYRSCGFEVRTTYNYYAYPLS